MSKIKNIILITVLILVGVSCTDFLEEKGYNSDTSYFRTADGLDALVSACYQQTRWAANEENQYALEDLGSDIYMLSGDGRHRDAFAQYLSTNLTPQESNLLEFWNNNYKGIASCNLALDYLNNNEEMLESIKSIRTGEALFLRAYYYYELVI